MPGLDEAADGHVDGLEPRPGAVFAHQARVVPAFAEGTTDDVALGLPFTGDEIEDISLGRRHNARAPTTEIAKAGVATQDGIAAARAGRVAVGADGHQAVCVRGVPGESPGDSGRGTRALEDRPHISKKDVRLAVLHFPKNRRQPGLGDDEVIVDESDQLSLRLLNAAVAGRRDIGDRFHDVAERGFVDRQPQGGNDGKGVAGGVVVDDDNFIGRLRRHHLFEAGSQARVEQLRPLIRAHHDAEGHRARRLWGADHRSASPCGIHGRSGHGRFHDSLADLSVASRLIGRRLRSSRRYCRRFLRSSARSSG